MTNFGKGLLALVVLCLAIALLVLLRDVLFGVSIGLLVAGGIIVLGGIVAVLLRIGVWAWGPIEHLLLKRAERRLMEARADAEAERVPLIPEGYIGTRLAHPAERANLVIWGGRGWSTEAPTLVAEEAEKEEEAAPRTPQPAVVRFSDIVHRIGAGQTLMGIRPTDGSLRLGTWAEYKTILILGKSSSGKTTTMTALALYAAKDGAMLILCDPHGHKEDSLLRKISPLAPLCFPGTTLAIGHHDILRNVQWARSELQRRVEGGAYDRPLLLVVEEWNRLQRDEEVAEEVALAALEIGQEGRGFGVYAIFGAQTMTGFAQVRRALISAIVHRVDEAEARRVIPGRYAKLAPELSIGMTYVLDADGQTEQLRQPLVVREDVAAMADRLSLPSGRWPAEPANLRQPPAGEPVAPPARTAAEIPIADIQAFQQQKKQQKKRYTEAERQEVLRLYFVEKVPKSRIHKRMGRETDFYYDVRDIIAEAEAQAQPTQAQANDT